MALSHCSANNNEQDSNKIHNYFITTNYDLLYNGYSITHINTGEDDLELTLNIVYKSNIPFTLDIGLIDNSFQRDITVRENTKYNKYTVYTIKLSKTGKEFHTSNVVIQIDGIKGSYHDLIFFIQNQEKLQSGSIRGYDFLRLNVNGKKNSLAKNNSNIMDTFIYAKEDDWFLALHPYVTKKREEIDCELQFNIDKIYEGQPFNDEYKNHLSEKIDFTVMILENNKLLNINDFNHYLYSESKIGENGKIKFSAHSRTENKEAITFVLVPYPFISYSDAERYQLIAYNNICYYHYNFYESIE